MTEEKCVFIFLDTMPQRQGSGASLRFYSNARAYLDLGFKVHVVQVATVPDGSQPSEDLEPVVWKSIIEKSLPPSILGKLAFRLGFPIESAVNYAFPIHSIVLREAKSILREYPNAFLHFDGESQANVIPWLPDGARAIWSLHDPPSLSSAAVARVASEANNRPLTRSEKREIRFMSKAERLMARKSSLVLCIGNHDAVRLRNDWNCTNAEYFPMSIPGDGADRDQNHWLANDQLRLLHLGSISHLPSYRSLEFIFENVFPRMSAELLSRIRLDVVGTVNEGERAKRILNLAKPFENVSFHGYVEDVVPYYGECDAQIVASTDALGLRTRIVESFAFGLPVISTFIAAEGLGGFVPGKHLLIADTPDEFVKQLKLLAGAPDLLTELSKNCRAFYVKHQSRKAVASALSGFLNKYLAAGASGPKGGLN